VGGHTIDDPEPKYGLAVTGLVDPKRAVTNRAAKAGGLLVLTKPLGVGIITTAIKKKRASPEAIGRVTQVMSTLNKEAAEAMLEVEVDACTDVTGFGLLGHLWEITQASGVGATVILGQVPVLPEAWEFVREGIVPGGTRANHQYLEEGVIWEDISVEEQLVLSDAQTSGGLLIVVRPEHCARLLRSLSQRKALAAAVIGEITAENPPHIRVRR
jgi:selenide,water dikinase